jgi:hypothetical protein
MQVESSRNDAQGTVGEGRERELSDVAGTLRRSDTVQQGVAAAVSFTITRASTTGVQGWQEGNQGELFGLILAELQDARQRQTTAIACLEQRQTAAMTCLEQRLESFTMDEATLRTEMLQQTAMLCEAREWQTAAMACLEQKLVNVQERLEKRMESIVDGMTQQTEGIVLKADGFAQEARESNAQTLDKLVALDAKIDKLAQVQEQQAKVHTAHILELQQGTTKARGQLLAHERDMERLRAESHTVICQLRQDLGNSFRNELEKMKDNELATFTQQLREIESGKSKKLTESILTMLQASERKLQQEFGQRIEGESNLLKSEILDQAVRIRNYCDDSCAVIKWDYQKELTVLAQRTDKNLADRQKKLDRSLRTMGKKYTGSQKELNNALQRLEETLLTKDAAGKSTGVTEALERRFESETKELDNKIKELNIKLKSLDNIVQHHERR